MLGGAPAVELDEGRGLLVLLAVQPDLAVPERLADEFAVMRRGGTVVDGTGLAPFVSMMRETLAAGHPRKTIVLHGCSFVDELGYRDELEAWQRDGTYPVTYVPTISRPADPRNAGWTGRTGRVEQVVHEVRRDLHLRPDRTVVYICGNPDMILNAESVLMNDGFPEFHVKKELYWPKGKVVPAAPDDSATS